MPGGRLPVRQKVRSPEFGQGRTLRHEAEPCFQPLLDVLGGEDILRELMYDQGEDGLVRVFVRRPRAGWCAIQRSCPLALYFDGAHWRASRSDGAGRVAVYETYRARVQLPGANNFCGPFAAYMAVHKGLGELRPGDYAHNIQFMSGVLLRMLEGRGRADVGREEMRAWLEGQVRDAGGGDLDSVMSLLARLEHDEDLARLLSQSHQ
jgi:hypothetical protein